MGKQFPIYRICKNITNASEKPSKVTNLTPEMLRTHCVSVRLNNIELQLLNTKRGFKSKGEWLRLAYLHNLPTTIPPINIEAWKALGEINQKLNIIALHIDSKNADSKLTHTELFAVRRHIKELRQNLLNADIWSEPYEVHAEDQTR